MNGRQVHALVAAGLRNPGLLDGWVRGCAVPPAGADPSGLDLAALRKFSGLVALVRHNGLREDLPRSFRLLAAAGLEIDLFADYAVHVDSSGRSFAPGTAARASELAAYAAGWIDRADAGQRHFVDVLRHETAVARIGSETVFPVRPGSAGAAASAGGVSAIRGIAVFLRFERDPRDDAGRPGGPVLLGYWREDAAAPLRILDLDIFSYELCRRVDGIATLAELSRVLTGGGPDPRFLAAVDELVALGVLAVAAP